jgi:acyl carrier protein
MKHLVRCQLLENLKTALREVAGERVNLESAAEDSRLVEDLGLHSLDLVELRHILECDWGVPVGDEVIVNLRTAGDVIDLVIERANLSRGR